MIEEDKATRDEIPDLLYNLLVPHLETLDEVLSPGLTLLRWTSLNIGDYVEKVRISLGELKILVHRAKDILDMRIDGNLKKIQSTSLCDLPDLDPWTLEEFTENISVI